VPVDSVEASITIKMALGASGEKAALLQLILASLHSGLVSILEVLHGVLYPEVHKNGFQKKKKKK
jgi:hypothetical protein